jgi:hypothetical protein
MNRDIEDVIANRSHNVEVLDVQIRSKDLVLRPRQWDTCVLINDHGAKVVIRQHRLTGAMRVKVVPAKDGPYQPEPYELEFLPDVPFDVLSNILEILK